VRFTRKSRLCCNASWQLGHLKGQGPPARNPDHHRSSRSWPTRIAGTLRHAHARCPQTSSRPAPARSTCRSGHGHAALRRPHQRQRHGAADTDLPLNSCAFAAAVHTRRAVTFPISSRPSSTTLLDLPPILRWSPCSPSRCFFEARCWVCGDFHRPTASLRQRRKTLLRRPRFARSRRPAKIPGSTPGFSKARTPFAKNERLTTLGLLAAEIAHEIRNPLTVLKLLHGGLGLDSPRTIRAARTCAVISDKLDQLEANVTRVLNFAKAPHQSPHPLLSPPKLFRTRLFSSGSNSRR